MRESRRRQTSVRFSLAILACGLTLIVCSSAQATSRSTAQLRHAFAQTFLAVRVTGNPAAACSLTTSEGQIALIQILRDDEGRYLPSTTCAEAIAEHAEAEHKLALLPLCTSTPSVSDLQSAIRKAVVHVTGNRGTVRLVDDLICGGENGRDLLPGPLGTSHWIRKRGRWLFDDHPTGTYSPAGRKAVAMLRSALSGSTIKDTLSNVAAFCANGSTNFTFFGTPIGSDGPWYVTGGYPFTAPFTAKQLGPPFDAQGNPQGMVFLYGHVSDEFDIKLVGGALVFLSRGGELTVTPGAAGC